MANISHFTQTVNGVSTTYDIHDANAVPRDGGAVLGQTFSRATSNSELRLDGGTTWGQGASLSLSGKDRPGAPALITLHTSDDTDTSDLLLRPNGIFALVTNGTLKYVAMQEDVIPRSGGAVMVGTELYRIDDAATLHISGGYNYYTGGSIVMRGANDNSSEKGSVNLQCHSATESRLMYLYPSGTWTWTGTACQLVSDQRYKQQIAEIDDKLLDAWEDVDLVQFKYNDAVDSKGSKARLHTGFVVQQIDDACKKHGVDISQYGLYCHEEYPQETEEVEIEQADGTKAKETKVIREASEHYSLRYTEALIVECKYLRRCVERLTARIEQLEKEQEAGK